MTLAAKLLRIDLGIRNANKITKCAKGESIQSKVMDKYNHFTIYIYISKKQKFTYSH